MMTDRDKLIELLEDTLYEWECDVSKETVMEIAEHLIENGVIVPPCKVGDTVYYFSCVFGAILPYLVENIHIAYLGEKGKNCFYTFEANYNHENELLDSIDFEYDDIGKIIFFTREEAERALNNRSGE